MAPILGYGASIQYSNDGGTTYQTALGQIESIVPPNIDATDVKITNLNSPNNFHEFMAGLGNGGEVSFKLIFDKTLMSTLYGFHRVTKFWKVTYSDLVTTASTWIFQAYLKGVTNEEFQADDKVMSTFKFKVTQKPTFTPGT